MEHFLELLDRVPPKYFSGLKDWHPDYGDIYSSVGAVKQWLKLIAESGLLTKKIDDPRNPTLS